tara:strand:+ start:203 stop:487 length:285 start_codon:yes stop_codon:yes gene_type:complete
MKTSIRGDLGLSNFDVKNEKLISDLKKYEDELKSICKDRSDAYGKLSSAVLKVRAGLSNLSEENLRKFEHAIKAIADGVEPNVAFQYEKDTPTG